MKKIIKPIYLLILLFIINNFSYCSNNGSNIIPKIGLGCPNPISPNGVLINLLPKFDWSDVEGASNYHLQVSLNPDFSFPVIDVLTTQSYYISIIPLIPFSFYYWRVRTGDGQSFGIFCWELMFRTGT